MAHLTTGSGLVCPECNLYKVAPWNYIHSNDIRCIECGIPVYLFIEAQNTQLTKDKKMEMTSRNMYFAEDGNYGDATGILIVPDYWFDGLPNELAQAIGDCHENHRLDFVDHLYRSPGSHHATFETCETCKIYL